MSDPSDSSSVTSTSSANSTLELENYNNNAAATNLRINGGYHLDESLELQCELKSLKSQVSQLKSELAHEREATVAVRKKLTTANKEKLEQASRFNDEATKLHRKNATLMAEVEKKNEYTEQLEFDLAKSKKQNEKDRKSFEEKSEDYLSNIQHLEATLKETKSKVKATEGQRAETEKNLEEQIEQLQETLADRDRILKEAMQEQQNVLAERNSCSEVLEQQQETITAHRQQFSELQTEFEKTKQHLIEANSQVKALKLAEEEYKLEIENLDAANKELAEAIEAERTAHMESKFNSELVQLKIRDLENSCQTQRGMSDELQETVDNLSGKVRELEQALNDEITAHKATHSKLERCEKEYALSQRQLQAELTDKRSLVSNLKQQLDLHQSNVDDLKTELNRAKKRQKYFEETYGGSMRELELMVMNFDLSPSPSPPRPDTTNTSAAEKPMSPHTVLETIRHTLHIYKKNLEEKTAELRKLTDSHDNVSKESSSTKDRLWAKEKALEEAQRALNHATKEVEVLRKTTSDQESRLSSLRTDLQDVKKDYENLQAKYNGLSNDLTNTKMSNLEQSEQKMRFIHGLYQRMIVPTSSSHSGSNGKVKVQPFDKFTWDDLTEMVFEQTVTLITQNSHLKDQISGLEQEVSQMTEKLESVKVDNDKRITDLNVSQERRGRAWDEEKQAMEQQYTTLLTEHQKQQQMSQKSYDEAWEQVRQATSSIEQMEKETADLKSRVSVLQKHNSSLLCAFGLMCGAYFPLMSRSKHLVHQRNILEEQLNRYTEFKSQITVLLNTLSSDDKAESQCTAANGPFMLLKFRKAVLVIIATYRLRKFVNSSRRVFQFTDSQSAQSVVCLGSLKYAKRRAFADQEAEKPDDVLSETDVVDWLSNKEVISCVMSATEEVMDALRRYTHKNPEKPCRPGLIMSAARTSFKKLLGRMETLYPMGSVNRSSPNRDRFSFIRLLTKGLNDAMSACSLDQKAKYLPTQHTLTSLQERVLNFIKMLHDSEIERRGLRQRVTLLSEAEQDLRQSEQTVETLQLELNIMKSQQERQVPSEKLDEVVAELDATLARERKAQELLHEQSEQLRALTKRLDEEEIRRSEQEGKIQESLQSMERNKGDMVQKMETIQQLKSRISNLELERTQLQNNVYDAEQALRTAAKDREYMGIYIKNLLASFEKCRADVIRRDISKLISAKNFLPDSQPTSEMLAVQSLVNAYTDSLRALHNHITGLNDEISSHKRHVARLKEELSAACTRQLSAPSQGIANLYSSQGRYNRMESTRLGHHLHDSDITPRFDKSLEFGSEADFMSVGNEPEYSHTGEDRSSTATGNAPVRQAPPPSVPSQSRDNFKHRNHSSSAFKPAGKQKKDQR